MRELLQPQFGQEQSDYARAVRAQQAFNPGGLDSGGFESTMAKGLGRLIADEGSRISSAMVADRAQQLQLAMQKYGIDAQTAATRMQIDSNQLIASMQNETQRLGITTNDALQRWLNDPNNNTVQKYGIDKNDILQRYIENLRLQGQEYAADKGLDAAALNRAAADSAAYANGQTQLAIAKINQQNFNAQLGQNAFQFGATNNFNWANLQGNLYTNDQNRQLQWFQLAQNMGLTPAQLAQLLAGSTGSGPVFQP